MIHLFGHHTRMEHSTLKIKPRTLPRDFLDVLIGLFVMLPILGAPVFFLPSGLVWWFSGSFLLGCLTLLVICAVWLCFAVWSLELSSDGIRFVRFWGTPRFLHWDEITDISEAPRSEVVLHGWLWPMFPAREMTQTLSGLGHFRICWNGGFAYFPPAHTEEFRRQVDEFRTKKEANKTLQENGVRRQMADTKSISISFGDLATMAGNTRRPLHELKPISHIHGRLELVIAGRQLPYLGYFGAADVCFDCWYVELANVAHAFSNSTGRYTFDEGEQGQPAFVFEREGEMAHLSIANADLSGGVADPEWQNIPFLPTDFLDEFQRFRRELIAAITTASPDVGPAWIRRHEERIQRQ